MKITRIVIAVVAISGALFSTAFGDHGGERYLIKFVAGRAAAGMTALDNAGAEIARRLEKQNAVAAYIPEKAVGNLQNNSNIEYIEVDPRRYPMAQVSPYGIGMVQANQVSDSNASNRTICIIDSGYDVGHEDLSGNMVTGTSDNGGAGDWFVDGCGHGTHVSGTIAALANNTGVVGVLPNGNTKLHIVKVFGNSCTWSYSSELINALNVCESEGANVVSMSLGCTGLFCDSVTEEQAFDAAYVNGILPIAAAGNSDTTTYSYPASYDSVISVSAVDSAMNFVSGFHHNDQVELAAPGLSVRSTVPMGTGAEEVVTVGSDAYEAKAMEGSPDASNSGVLVDCGLGTSPCIGVSGAVCLIERGDITFADKVQNCEAGGGVGAVIYNNVDGLIWGTLAGASTNIPSVGFSRADGIELLQGRLGDPTTVTTTAGGNYAYFNGTSMATPHVAGVAALIWSHGAGWSNVQIRNALAATAMDLGAADRDEYYGWGLVQAQAALDCLNGSACDAPNAPPVADFSYACIELDCTFDAGASSDDDGIASYSWDFGDGSAPAVGVITAHTFVAGAYTVTLTVTDNEGKTDQDWQNVTVPMITLTASGHKERGRHIIDLEWSGSMSVDIYRSTDGSLDLLIEGVAGITYTDQPGTKGRANFIYQVCEAGTSVCSNQVSVSF